MTELTIEKVYNAYALFYDQVFGKIFHPGRHMSVDIINAQAKPGARVLEVGIGTGLSLPLYRPDLEICGIDISEKMLHKAEKRVQTGKVPAKVDLKKMDAKNLQYEDDYFDCVVAMYVASVVDDVNQFLNEICRVCKPDGEIIFVNHFSSDNPAMKLIEKKVGRVHSLIGFKSDFQVDSILSHESLRLVHCHKTNLFGYWKLLHCKLN